MTKSLLFIVLLLVGDLAFAKYDFFLYLSAGQHNGKQSFVDENSNNSSITTKKSSFFQLESGFQFTDKNYLNLYYLKQNVKLDIDSGISSERESYSSKEYQLQYEKRYKYTSIGTYLINIESTMALLNGSTITSYDYKHIGLGLFAKLRAFAKGKSGIELKLFYHNMFFADKIGPYELESASTYGLRIEAFDRYRFIFAEGKQSPNTLNGFEFKELNLNFGLGLRF